MKEYSYGQPVKGKMVATHPAKRCCKAPGCLTRLSIYNASELCWLHDSRILRPRPSPTRG
jgi:hypothetical protein